jgi:hypothetical protein
VSIFVATRQKSLVEVRSSLENLLRGFETDPSGHRKLIRDMLDNDRKAFYAGAIDILKCSGDSRGSTWSR